MVFYAAFNSISVISRRQLTLFMLSWVSPVLGQEVKVKVDIVTSDDIKIYYTGKFQDFTARYIIKWVKQLLEEAVTAFESVFCTLLHYGSLPFYLKVRVTNDNSARRLRVLHW